MNATRHYPAALPEFRQLEHALAQEQRTKREMHRLLSKCRAFVGARLGEDEADKLYDEITLAMEGWVNG